MKKLNHKTQSKSKNLTAVKGNPDDDYGLHIDARLLIKRVNSLVAHVSNLDGGDEAEKNSRETSAHIKNIKEIMALNDTIKQVKEQVQESHVYTPKEEQALAEELAALIIKNGGFS